MRDPSEFFAHLPEIETERLVLRTMRLDDAEAMFAYASDPRVAEHVDWYPHGSVEESRRFLVAAIERYARGAPVGWAITLRGEDKLVGSAGFFDWAIAHARAEIGYSLAYWLWNRGYMTEAVRALVRFGFERMGLNRIEARCKVVNLASARVLEKAGFRLEGVLRQHQHTKGAFEDMKLYAILREDWQPPERGGITP